MVNCPICLASEKLLVKGLKEGEWKCLTCGIKFTIEEEKNENEIT